MRFREELDMVSVGKTTYLAYISGNVKAAYHQNVAIDILEWYHGKPISEMSLEEVLEALKALWLAGNYFNKINLELGAEGTYLIFFYHNLRNKQYGEFWGGYFSELLSTHKSCKTEIFVREESFILKIAQNHPP